MVISVWTILLGLFAVSILFRILRRMPHFGLMLGIAALTMACLMAARLREKEQMTQAQLQCDLAEQTAALSRQSAAFAQHARAGEIARQKAEREAKGFGLQLPKEFAFNQRFDVRGPRIVTIPTPPKMTPPRTTPPKVTPPTLWPLAVVTPTMGALPSAPRIQVHADWSKLWIVAVPALCALAALSAVSRRRRDSGGSGFGWLAAGIAVVVLIGYIFVGQRNVKIGPKSSGFGYDDGNVTADVASRESIDAVWERLSAPQIKLELEQGGMTPDQVTAAQAKLNEAAKVLEAAAEKMTDSSSQSWLVVMAEALLKATASKSPPGTTSAQAQPPLAAALPAAAAAPVQATPPSRPTSPAAAKQRVAVGRRMPAWVVQPPGIVGSVRKYVVHAGPYKTLEECHQDLEQKMRDVVQSHVSELTATATQESNIYPNLFQLGIGTDYILRELCTEEYVETNNFDFGEMLTAHALMEFTPAQDAALKDRWTAYARQFGVARTAAGAGLVVGCLVLAFGLLKVDTWTRGYYTKRLFLGVPAAIIALLMLMHLA